MFVLHHQLGSEYLNCNMCRNKYHRPNENQKGWWHTFVGRNCLPKWTTQQDYCVAHEIIIKTDTLGQWAVTLSGFVFVGDCTLSD